MATNRELSTLGRTLAEMQDHALAERTSPSTNDILNGAYVKRNRDAARRALLRPVAVAVLTAAVTAALFMLFYRPSPLGFVVGEARRVGQMGDWLRAPPDRPKTLSFSDGSRVMLQAGTQARVASSNEHGARVVLERGTLRADVVPRRNNEWFVVGGPFAIRVTGTSFDAAWDPEHATLRVAMYTGHVVVNSECLSDDRTLAAGESATLSCATDRPAEVSTPSERPQPRVAEVNATPSAVSLAPPPIRGVAPEASGSSAPIISWRELARHGSYKQALASAEAAGFDQLCETLPVLELFELATATRLAGNGARATQAYLAIRRRFPGTDSAASAAFHLGQLAFDGSSAFDEAHRWFGLYLAERPAGTLAAEALGRTMEAEQRLGDLAAARNTAALYLNRYPTGAHARLAESLQNP